MRRVDFSLLERLHEAAAWAAVGFSVVYEEGSDQWYTTIESAAPTERFVSRTRSLETAIEMALDWLAELKKRGDAYQKEIKRRKREGA